MQRFQTSTTGMVSFVVIWIGQAASLTGTAMTQFAITIWAWQETGQATALALVAFFSFAPVVLLSPLAGALVDRWNRKLVMMLSDIGAGIATIVTLFLFASGNLEIWHLYVLGAWTGAFSAFQFPAYSAAISTMVDKSQYARTSGMLSLAESGSSIAAPILAGGLLAIIGLGGILIIDMATFIIALITLLITPIAQPKTSSDAIQLSLGEDLIFGFRYIWQKKPLLAVQLVFMATNLTAGFSYFMIAPLILARTASNELVLASVQSAAGIGGVLGGLLLTLWGGPKKRIHGVLISMILYSLLGSMVLGSAQSIPLWIVGAFFMMATIPIMNGSNQAIWQSKVPPSLQGRVFATRRLIAQITAPVAMIASGVLADEVFEPAMAAGGGLEPIFGWLVGVGAGAGIGLLCLLSGVVGVIAITIAYSSPLVVQVETLLPDHDET